VLCGVYKTGITNVLLTTPLWVANTRLKLQGTRLKMGNNSHGGCSLRLTKYTGLVGKLLHTVANRASSSSFLAGNTKIA